MQTGHEQVDASASFEGAFGDELASGTPVLHGQFHIEDFLNAGGFGITYTARDSLDRKVVLKECFPSAFCRRSNMSVSPRVRSHKEELSNIIASFVAEAKSLAKLSHPNIVGVHQVFEDNNTAYMALDYVDGRDLLEIIEDPDQSLDPKQIQALLVQLLDAISYIHSADILHRDISPDNILIDQSGVPILIDFGAAREQVSQKNKALSQLRVVKDGYSPQEFYVVGAEQGPTSDLYSLAATFYHLISGELPVDSQERLSAAATGDPDPCRPLAGTIKGYPKRFLAAIDKAMAVFPADRMASADDWLTDITGSSTARRVHDLPSRSKWQRLLDDWRPSFAFAGVTGVAMFALGAFAFKPEVPVSPGQSAARANPGVVASQSESTSHAPEMTPAEGPEADEQVVVTQGMFGLYDPKQFVKNTATKLFPKEEVAKTNLPELQVRRRIELPYEVVDPDTNRRIRVFAVNGMDVHSQVELDEVLAGQVSSWTGKSVQVTVLAGPTRATARHELLQLRVSDRLVLPNGLAFEAQQEGTKWTTRVANVPPGLQVEMQPGDVLVGDLKTSYLLSEADALGQILERGLRDGETQFAFAVQRGASTWAAEIDLGTSEHTK